jgi:hypothetical protein
MRWIILAFMLACSTSPATKDLLSATRLVLVEKQSATVEVDVGSAGDFSVAPPAISGTITIDKSAGVFTVTPGCDVSTGPDVTVPLVVTAGGRQETLLLVVSDNRTLDCFQHVDVAMPNSLVPAQLACLDLDGDGQLELFAFEPSGTTLVRAKLPDATTIEIPTGSVCPSKPCQMQQMFALPTSTGLALAAVDATGDLFELAGTAWAPVAGIGTVGNHAVPLSSSGGPVPDYLVAIERPTPGMPPPAVVQFTPLIPGSKKGAGTEGLLSGTMGGLGGVLGVGAWGAGHDQLVAASVNSPVSSGPQIVTYTIDWQGALMGMAPTMTVTGYTPNIVEPTYPPQSQNVAAIATLAARSGSTGADAILSIVVGSSGFDTVIDEASAPLTSNVVARSYGGVRSIAAAPDGGVLLGADQGAVMTRYQDGAPPSYQAIDLVASQPGTIPDEGYGNTITPCIDKNGQLAGYAVIAGQKTYMDPWVIRVAQLPDPL